MAVYHAKTKIVRIVVQRIACGPLVAAAPAYRAAVRWSTAVGKRLSRRSAELSLSVTWRKHERAVEDAGPYGVRERGHGRANRGTDPSPYEVCPSGCAGE